MRPEALEKRNKPIHVMWLISWTSPPKLQFGHSWARPCQVRGYIQMQLQFWTNYRKVGDKICLWGFFFFFFAFYTGVLLLLEKAMAPHSNTLAWKIPWTEEPGRLQPMGSPRVGHDWVTSLSLFTFIHWRRKWQPTPVFLPRESQGHGSLVGYRLWGRTELDTTEAT